MNKLQVIAESILDLNQSKKINLLYFHGNIQEYAWQFHDTILSFKESSRIKLILDKWHNISKTNVMKDNYIHVLYKKHVLERLI